MKIFYDQAVQFVTCLSLGEKKKMFYDLAKIIQKHQHLTQRKHTWSDRIFFSTKTYQHYKQLLLFKNNHNDELIIREVHQTNLFTHHAHFEVFLNFKEIPFDYVNILFNILKTELYTIEFA
ncbi:hypothetical protein IV487_08320 [Enterococcus saccharolyticus]|uniref:hypothetical protein n=1 Tax=Enterococcus saccharolyticus TaxID=41997 RepID=UPI001E55E2A6|nr:hypothetical protein [Enterococcus saccharolyticus]MCD5002465.1 hypothetical protein [Enterococcus saccharolyticus]